MPLHGKCNTKTYNTWRAMKERCLNKNSRGYKFYGSKGITVCEKWLTFEGFFEDMGSRPEGTTLDRMDRKQGYYKENCRWVGSNIQAKNRGLFSNSTSGITGVCYRKQDNKWVAYLRYAGKVYINLAFHTKELATIARKKAETDLFKDHPELL